MNEIEISSLINESKLNSKEYFITLLNEGIFVGLIDEQKTMEIQNGCMLLLKEVIVARNGDFSSSIRIEKAQDLMASITYILGLALKDTSSHDEAVKKLKNTNIEDLYRQGLKRADILLKSSKLLYSKMLAKHINVNNIYYNSIFYKQIRLCLKKYNSEISANEIPISLDYPLCNPINDLIGIEYISKYVETLCYENEFCCKFSSESITRILSIYNKDFYELPINVFKQTLVVAIGCIMAKANPVDLYLSTFDLKNILMAVSKKTTDDIHATLNESISELFVTLKITKTSVRKYIISCLPSIAKEIYLLSQINKLQLYFMIEKSTNNDDNNVCFSYNDRMSKNEYQEVLRKIIQIKDSRERATLIVKSITSIEDLIETIHEPSISNSDIECILGNMDVFSLAVLFNKVSEQVDFDLLYVKIIDSINSKINSMNNNQQELFKNSLNILRATPHN